MRVGKFQRIVGLARSFIIYHGIPLRQRKLRELYHSLIQPGDLFFDIGAHVGNHTRALASIGARVIAFEPQSPYDRFLTRLFRGSKNVTVLPQAVGSQAGEMPFFISRSHPTVSTLSAAWIAQVR